METVATILPMFIIIFLGWFARQKGFIPPEFLGPANRLTYFFAIPALVFQSIYRGSLREDFHGGVLLATLAASSIIYASVWIFCRFRVLPAGRAGAMIQSAGHGNLGYVGLPFAFYFLGEIGLVKAGIISAFLAILQNILSVSALQAFTAAERAGVKTNGAFLKLVGNPVILAATAGILASGLNVPIPAIIQRTLSMLGGLGPPLALLLIGASLSFRTMRTQFWAVMVIVFIKLFLLPAVGLALYRTFNLPVSNYLPALILLASPTATIAYVMTREMKGDVDFVIAAISTSTLLSAGTYLFWMTVIADNIR